MDMLKLLTGFAVIHDTAGKRISYTYNKVDQTGTIKEQNTKESYMVLDDETSKLIEQLELKIKERLDRESATV